MLGIVKYLIAEICFKSHDSSELCVILYYFSSTKLYFFPVKVLAHNLAIILVLGLVSKPVNVRIRC